MLRDAIPVHRCKLWRTDLVMQVLPHDPLQSSVWLQLDGPFSAGAAPAGAPALQPFHQSSIFKGFFLIKGQFICFKTWIFLRSVSYEKLNVFRRGFL